MYLQSLEILDLVYLGLIYLQAMDATLGATEVPSNSAMAVEDTCGMYNEVSLALFPDNLCNACCEMDGYECTNDDLVGLQVKGSNTTVAGNTTVASNTTVAHIGNANSCSEGIGMEYNEYKQKLGQSPTPKVMHAVDRDAIMAIIEGSDGDDLDSNSYYDRSVTSSGSDEVMGHGAVHVEQCAVDVDGPEPGTWNADDGSYSSSTEPDSEEILIGMI